MYMYNDIAGAVHVQAWPCEAGDRSGSLVEQHGDHSTLCESTSALEWSLGAADPLVDPLIASGSSTKKSAGVSNKTALPVRSNSPVWIRRRRQGCLT